MLAIYLNQVNFRVGLSFLSFSANVDTGAGSARFTAKQITHAHQKTHSISFQLRATAVSSRSCNATTAASKHAIPSFKSRQRATIPNLKQARRTRATVGEAKEL